jgi:DNA-binding GntR family transcriptional regulator
MSSRLQVLVPPQLDSRIRKAAQRSRLSKGAWVRRALERALREGIDSRATTEDPVARLAGLNGPTADIRKMLAEIEAGRR